MGMVSTIADDPPMLNWIFVDKDTGFVRHGGRQETLGGHTIGPWFWTDDEQRLTLEEDDAQFVAVWMEEEKKWAIAYDRDGSIRDDGEEAGFSDYESSGDDSEAEGSDREEPAKGRGLKKKASVTVDDDRRGARSNGRRQRWAGVRLNRKLQLGMESRFVKGPGANK